MSGSINPPENAVRTDRHRTRLLGLDQRRREPHDVPVFTRPKNLGTVVLRGKALHLGRYDSPESWEKYHRLFADLHATPAATPSAPEQAQPDVGPTLDELLAAFWDRHVTAYYVKDGRPTSEQDNLRQALRPGGRPVRNPASTRTAGRSARRA